MSYACARGVSQRRACELAQVARSELKYMPKMPVRDSEAFGKIRCIAKAHPRFGYRRIGALLATDGVAMSNDRAYRLWHSAGLQIPRRRPRKRVAQNAPRPLQPTRANEVWAYDFVFDSCANGQQLKCLTVIDEFTRESLAIDVGARIRSGRVIEVLSKLVSDRGPPRFLRSDNGPEFIAKALITWLERAGIATAHIEPGKPWQNGCAESFNGKFRDECLNMEWFRNRVEARVVIEEWRTTYNHVRPHSSLKYRTPAAFRLQAQQREVEALLQ